MAASKLFLSMARWASSRGSFSGFESFCFWDGRGEADWDEGTVALKRAPTRVAGLIGSGTAAVCCAATKTATPTRYRAIGRARAGFMGRRRGNSLHLEL